VQTTADISSQGPRQLAVIGAGGHGGVVADAAELLGWNVEFFDDHARGTIAGWPIVGTVSDLLNAPRSVDGAIVTIGNNGVRLELTRRLIAAGVFVTTIVHPSATMSFRARLGLGTFVAAAAVVNVGASLGLATIVNTGATVDHDCLLADGVHLSPGVHLSGAVTIGERTWLGTGSSVRNNLMIGRDAVVGVGSAVVANIPDCVVVQGVPARVVREHPALR
jgi:sugar O-acyltransferase (sialic acid O-acetyltransferase NeuD family)